MTVFLKRIYAKRTRENDKLFKKDIEEWRRVVPSFSFFRAMIDTIVELELYFLYDNSEKSNIHLVMRKGQPTDTIIFDCEDMTITVKLSVLQDNNEIQEITNITIKRRLGYQRETNLKYKNDDADTYLHSTEDMMLYGIVEYRITKMFCDLLEYYYYNGPHREIDPSLLYKD